MGTNDRYSYNGLVWNGGVILGRWMDSFIHGLNDWMVELMEVVVLPGEQSLLFHHHLHIRRWSVVKQWQKLPSWDRKLRWQGLWHLLVFVTPWTESSDAVGTVDQKTRFVGDSLAHREKNGRLKRFWWYVNHARWERLAPNQVLRKISHPNIASKLHFAFLTPALGCHVIGSLILRWGAFPRPQEEYRSLLPRAGVTFSKTDLSKNPGHFRAVGDPWRVSPPKKVVLSQNEKHPRNWGTVLAEICRNSSGRPELGILDGAQWVFWGADTKSFLGSYNHGKVYKKTSKKALTVMIFT